MEKRNFTVQFNSLSKKIIDVFINFFLFYIIDNYRKINFISYILFCMISIKYF